ncbi:MAG: hypothetical protein V4681_01965 [Patescibacteria group bacterium]
MDKFIKENKPLITRFGIGLGLLVLAGAAVIGIASAKSKEE